MLLAQQRGGGAVKLTVHFFSHYETQALMIPTQSVRFGAAEKNTSSAPSARVGHRGETNCEKHKNQRWLGCTHRGRELQLRSLSVALLEELAGH